MNFYSLIQQGLYRSPIFILKDCSRKAAVPSPRLKTKFDVDTSCWYGNTRGNDIPTTHQTIQAKNVKSIRQTVAKIKTSQKSLKSRKKEIQTIIGSIEKSIFSGKVAVNYHRKRIVQLEQEVEKIIKINI